MTWPNTDPTTNTFVDGWHPAGAHEPAAQIWHVTSPAKGERFEANVYKGGQMIATIEAKTREELEIEQPYG